MTAAQRDEKLNKVPQVTLFFWIIKILATTIGETGADFLNVRLGFGLIGTSLVMVALLALVLTMQTRKDRYVPWIYWVVVVLLSVVGTLLTDLLTDKLGLSLYISTIGFAIALSITFAAWYRSERTLSIHDITSSRREAFYWLAILFTFALGTAAGDLIAEKLSLGYAFSLMIFASGIALITLAYYAFGLNSVLAFWLAYILTRPLGASMGDLLTQPHGAGGLALGTSLVSGIFLAIIFALVTYLTVSKRDQDCKDKLDSCQALSG